LIRYGAAKLERPDRLGEPFSWRRSTSVKANPCDEPASCLKFMRTLWVCNVAGGPQQYAATKPGSTPLGLEEAHRQLKISPAEFDEVAAELARTLDFFKVPEQEKGEVLSAFAAHKGEVTEGYS
jgi:hypothetical protein